jgi:hypothetical protein
MPNNQAAGALDISIELSEFGILANSTDDLDLLLKTACKTVTHALRTDMAKVLERVPETENLMRVKVAYGFEADPEPGDREILGNSAAGYALISR